jgi:serine/threonine-protein kinase RsbW
LAGPDPELDLEFPPRPEFVRVARHAIGALARMHGVTQGIVEDVKLAVSEGCTAAVAANSEAGVTEPVQLRAWVGAESVVIEVLDRSREPDQLVAGNPRQINTGELPFERLLSVPIIRGLVDEVSIGRREDGPGTSLRMVVSIAEDDSI